MTNGRDLRLRAKEVAEVTIRLHGLVPEVYSVKVGEDLKWKYWKVRLSSTLGHRASHLSLREVYDTGLSAAREARLERWGGSSIWVTVTTEDSK